MKKILTTLTLTALTLTMSSAFASPKKLVIHNQTNVDSCAYVAGEVPPRHPARANCTNYISWTEVRIACLGRTLANKTCPAVIKMNINTPNVTDLGVVYLNVDTGEISPKVLHGNGFKLTVNGPGEATLTYDNAK